MSDTPTPEKGGGEHEKKGTSGEKDKTIPPRKPRRSLNSYNLFAMMHRAYILQTASKPVIPDLKPEEVDQNTSSRPTKYRDVVMPKDWYLWRDTPTKKKNVNKKDRVLHGVISFTDLTRNIANEWNTIDAKDKKFFEDLAEEALQRYTAALDDYYAKFGFNAEENETPRSSGDDTSQHENEGDKKMVATGGQPLSHGFSVQYLNGDAHPSRAECRGTPMGVGGRFAAHPQPPAPAHRAEAHFSHHHQVATTNHGAPHVGRADFSYTQPQHASSANHIGIQTLQLAQDTRFVVPTNNSHAAHHAPIRSRPSPEPAKPCGAFDLFFRLEKNLILQTFNNKDYPTSAGTKDTLIVAPGEEVDNDESTRPSKYSKIIQPRNWFLEDTPDLAWVDQKGRDRTGLREKIVERWNQLDEDSRFYFTDVAKYLRRKYEQKKAEIAERYNEAHMMHVNKKIRTMGTYGQPMNNNGLGPPRVAAPHYFAPPPNQSHHHHHHQHQHHLHPAAGPARTYKHRHQPHPHHHPTTMMKTEESGMPATNNNHYEAMQESVSGMRGQAATRDGPEAVKVQIIEAENPPITDLSVNPSQQYQQLQEEVTKLRKYAKIQSRQLRQQELHLKSVELEKEVARLQSVAIEQSKKLQEQHILLQSILEQDNQFVDNSRQQLTSEIRNERVDLTQQKRAAQSAGTAQPELQPMQQVKVPQEVISAPIPETSKASFAWTDEEDWALLELYKMHGENWALISCLLPGRTLDEVTSRWILLSKKQHAVEGMLSLDANHHAIAKSGNEDSVSKLSSGEPSPPTTPALPLKTVIQQVIPFTMINRGDGDPQFADADDESFNSGESVSSKKEPTLAGVSPCRNPNNPSDYHAESEKKSPSPKKPEIGTIAPPKESLKKMMKSFSVIRKKK